MHRKLFKHYVQRRKPLRKSYNLKLCDLSVQTLVYDQCHTYQKFVKGFFFRLIMAYMLDSSIVDSNCARGVARNLADAHAVGSRCLRFDLSP